MDGQAGHVGSDELADFFALRGGECGWEREKKLWLRPLQAEAGVFGVIVVQKKGRLERLREVGADFFDAAAGEEADPLLCGVKAAFLCELIAGDGREWEIS